MSVPYATFHIVEKFTGSAILCGNGNGRWIVVDCDTVTMEQLTKTGVCSDCARIALSMRVDRALEGPRELTEAQRLGYRAGLSNADMEMLRKKVLP